MTAEARLTIFTTAEPTCHCNGQVKMLPWVQWQEFKFFYRAHTLIHLIAWRDNVWKKVEDEESYRSKNQGSPQRRVYLSFKILNSMISFYTRIIHRSYQSIQLLLLRTGRQWLQCQWLSPKQRPLQLPAQHRPLLPPTGLPAHLSHLAQRVQSVQKKEQASANVCKVKHLREKFKKSTCGELMQAAVSTFN